MKTEQTNILISLRAAQTFVDENAATLGSVVTSGAKKDLDDGILSLSASRSNQMGNALSAQSATQKHKSLRTVLMRDHMAPIARIALAKLPQTPEIAPLRLPHGRPNLAALTSAAFGMAEAAAPFANVFTSSGLPADFLSQLRTVATATLDAVNERVQSGGKAKGATDGMKEQIIAARHSLRVVDAFVRTALKDEPTLLSNWNKVKRVTNRRVRSTPVIPAPVPGPALAERLTVGSEAAASLPSLAPLKPLSP